MDIDEIWISIRNLHSNTPNSIQPTLFPCLICCRAPCEVETKSRHEKLIIKHKQTGNLFYIEHLLQTKAVGEAPPSLNLRKYFWFMKGSDKPGMLLKRKCRNYTSVHPVREQGCLWLCVCFSTVGINSCCFTWLAISSHQTGVRLNTLWR